MHQIHVPEGEDNHDYKFFVLICTSKALMLLNSKLSYVTPLILILIN